MTLVIIYFLFKINGYFWRIYTRFKLPANNVVTGAFNVNAGGGADAYQQQQQQACTSRGGMHRGRRAADAVVARVSSGEAIATCSLPSTLHLPSHAPLPRWPQEAEEARQAAEMAELHAKYAHLPESVRASMGISSAAGAPGPSHGYQ